MRRVAFVVLTALTTAGCAFVPYTILSRHGHRTTSYTAPPHGRWDNVMRLPPTALIEVLTADGRVHRGGFVRADVQIVGIQVADAVRELPRDDVVRVDLVDLPGSKTTAVIRKGALGALLGVAGMTVVAGVIGGEVWPPPGVLMRAGAAGGAYTAGQAELIRRQPGVIYVAPHFRW